MRLGVNRRARDTFERRRHFRSTDNANSRDLTRESARDMVIVVAAATVVENHREERDTLSLFGEKEREGFFLTVE